MRSEKPGMAAGLRDGSTIKGNDHTDRIANAQAPATASSCQFCNAPQIKPNCAERRRGVTDFTMQHEHWCRVFGSPGRAFGPSRRPR